MDGADGADAGADTEGVNDGLRLLLTAGVSVAAVSGFGLAASSAATSFAFPTVSAGSGAAGFDLVSAAPSAAFAASPGGMSPLVSPFR